MHILAVLTRMHIFDVLLLMLATMVIAQLFWDLQHCNSIAQAQVCVTYMSLSVPLSLFVHLYMAILL